MAGVPVVVCCHEASRELTLLGPITRLIYRALRWAGSRFVVFSPAEQAVVTESGLLPSVSNVPLGIDETIVEEADVGRIKARYGLVEPTVLALGWITHSKGTDILLRAVQLMSEIGTEVQCVIAGEVRPRVGVFRPFGRADAQYVRALRHDPAVQSGRARMIGYVPEDDVAPLIQAATVLVLPYRSVTQSGIAARALATRTAIVASALPGMTAQLGGAARYFRVGDAYDLAMTLRIVLDEDGCVREELESARRERARMESYSRVAQLLLDVGGVASGS